MSLLAVLRFWLPRRGTPWRILLPLVKWGALWGMLYVAQRLGRQTRFGEACVGLTALLLVVEAWAFAGRRFRTRLLHTLAFALPLYSLLMFGAALYSAYCHYCDQRPAAKLLRSFEAVAEFFYLNSCAALPTLALLVLVYRRRAPPAEKGAYLLASRVVLLTTLLVSVTFGATAYLLTRDFSRTIACASKDSVHLVRPAGGSSTPSR